MNLGTGAKAFTAERSAENKVLFCVTFSRDGRRIIAAGYDGVLRVWNPATGHLIGPLGRHDREVYDLAMSANGRYLASNSNDGKVKIWDGTRFDSATV